MSQGPGTACAGEAGVGLQARDNCGPNQSFFIKEHVACNVGLGSESKAAAAVIDATPRDSGGLKGSTHEEDLTATMGR
jgi:hypothetical protein